MIGAWLLGLLAVASVSVLVGGRMADQTRRVGLLKAVGGTPSLVAAVLLAEYVLVALVAAAAGLAVGLLTAPLLTESSAGLIGSAGTPPITLSTVGSVTAVALGVAAVATFVPAVRAARTSTVHALADSARPPRRTGWLIAISAGLPVPLLLALRVAARRPRPVLLGVVSITITVSGIFVALVLNAFLTSERQAGGLDDAQAELLSQVLLVVMVMVLALAAVNAIFITWATVLDNRQSSALARALGATPGEVSAALAAAQVLPALVGAILGAFPGGFALFHAINAITGGDSDRRHASAALAAARPGGGDRVRGGVAHGHSRPPRRPPSRDRDAPSRTCLMLTPDRTDGSDIEPAERRRSPGCEFSEPRATRRSASGNAGSRCRSAVRTTDRAMETTIHRTVPVRTPATHRRLAVGASSGCLQAPVLIGSFSGRGVRQYVAAEAADCSSAWLVLNR